MKIPLKLLVVLTLLALLPLRGLADATIGICAGVGEEPGAAHSHAEHSTPHHHHGDAPDPDSGAKPDCNACAEHCAGTSFVAPEPPPLMGPEAGPERIALGHRLEAGFVPDHLDPPPLVS